MVRRYAEDTRVPAEKTRLEIEALMQKRGADQFFSGADKDRAALAFRINDRQMRFTLPLTDCTPQQIRARWRTLLLVIKARLEAIDIGIVSFEEAFLAETVLPDRSTVAETMVPQIENAYRSGKMPPLLQWSGHNHG